MNLGRYNEVIVRGIITCENQNECQATLTQNNVVIHGDPTVPSGFKRIGNWNYYILDVKNSSQITLSDLTFDDSAGLGCEGAPTHNCCPTTYGCKGSLSITSSQNVSIQRVHLLGSRHFGLALMGEGNNRITVQNSSIKNTFKHGVWGLTNNILYDSNYFYRTGASSIFSRNYPGGVAGEYRNNIIEQCQWDPDWQIQGGQLNIQNINQLKVVGNTIKNGTLTHSLTPGVSAGIELSYYNSNIEIRDNLIFNNTGWAIIENLSSEHYSTNVQITNNVFYSNGTNRINVPGSQMNSNCDNANCSSQQTTIENAGLNLNFNPYVLWISGQNLTDDLTVEIYEGPSQWMSVTNYSLARDKSFLSLELVSNQPPSDCHISGSCSLKIRVKRGSLVIKDNLFVSLP